MAHYDLLFLNETTLPVDTDIDDDVLYVIKDNDELRYCLRYNDTPYRGCITKTDLPQCPISTINSEGQLRPFLNDILQQIISTHESIDLSQKTTCPVFVTHQWARKPVNIGLKLSRFVDPTEPLRTFVSPLVSVEREEETSSPSQREVIFLVDVSGSMGESPDSGIQGVYNMLPKIFTTLNDTDLITLITFNTDITRIIYQGTKASLISTFETTVTSLIANGGTKFNDALLSINKSDIIQQGHASIVIISDGADNQSKLLKGKGEQVVTTLINRFSEAHDHCPPKIITIGIGSAYDTKTLEAMGNETKSGLLDARDPKTLVSNCAYITNNLALGIPIQLQTNTEAQPISLGIVNYNTELHENPLYLPTEESGTIRWRIGDTADFATTAGESLVDITDLKQKKAIISKYVRTKIEQINKDLTRDNIEPKFDEMTRWASQYHEYLNSITQKQIKLRLKELELRVLYKQFYDLVFLKNQQTLTTSRLETAVAALQAQQQLIAIHNTEHNFLELLITHTATNKQLNPNQIPSIDNNGHLVFSRLETFANQYIDLSSSTGYSFGANMSAPMRGHPRSSPNNIRLTRDIDFVDYSRRARHTTLNIESLFADRETIVVSLGSQQLQTCYDEFYDKIISTPFYHDSIEGILDHVTQLLAQFVQQKLSKKDLSLIGILPQVGPHISINLDLCLTQQTGVCRHQALLTAYLLGKLVANGALFSGQVTHYRCPSYDLKSHSIVIYRNENTKTYYLIDATFGLFQKIKSNSDFANCVERYNQLGLRGFLRNFANDYGYHYPKEDYTPLGSEGVNLLERLANRDTSIAQQLRASSIAFTTNGATNEITIIQSQETQPALWALLMQHQCIFAEERATAQDITAEQMAAIQKSAQQALLSNPTSPIAREKCGLSHQVKVLATVTNPTTQQQATTTTAPNSNAQDAPHAPVTKPITQPEKAPTSVLSHNNLPVTDTSPSTLNVDTPLTDATNQRPSHYEDKLQPIIRNCTNAKLKYALIHFQKTLDKLLASKKIRARERYQAIRETTNFLEKMGEAYNQPASKRENILKQYQAIANTMQGHSSPRQQRIGIALSILGAAIAALGLIIPILIPIGATLTATGIGFFTKGSLVNGVAKEMKHVATHAISP